MTAARVEQFWCEFFGVPMEALNTPGVAVVPHNSLGSYEGAWLFMRGTSGIVSCPRKWVTRVQTAVSGASASSLQDPSLLSRLFGEEVTGMMGRRTREAPWSPRSFAPIGIIPFALSRPRNARC